MSSCACGCGETPPTIQKTNTARGYVKGEPHRYVRGHQMIGRTYSAETKQKMSEAKLGRGNGFLHSEGYVVIRVDGVSVLEHRHIMAQHLGRPLTDEEVVHHEDHNRTNNDITNLRLFANQGEHRRYHARKNR